MLAPKIDVATIHPVRDRILAMQYVRPATYGSIHLPESYDKDGTWNWWEAVAAGPAVKEKLGIELQPGDIFRTPWRPAIDLGMECDKTGRRLFMVACTVQRVERGKMVEDMNVTGVLKKDWQD